APLPFGDEVAQRALPRSRRLAGAHPAARGFLVAGVVRLACRAFGRQGRAAAARTGGNAVCGRCRRAGQLRADAVRLALSKRPGLTEIKLPVVFLVFLIFVGLSDSE